MLLQPPTYCFLAGELVGLYEAILKLTPAQNVNVEYYRNRLEYLRSLTLDKAAIERIKQELDKLDLYQNLLNVRR